jgi:hypothetical protein
MASFCCLRKLSLLALLLFLTSPPAIASQESDGHTADNRLQYLNYQLVGQADIYWLWIKLYQAKLRTASGHYHGTPTSLSLELTYARAFSRDELLKATLKEWQRQHIDYLPQWEAELRNIWPNISPDDHLLLFVDSRGHSYFYYNTVFIGALENAAFAKAFTDIWLSENTQKPSLRHQLIGYKP